MSDSEDRPNTPALPEKEATKANTESASQLDDESHRDEQVANAVAFLSHPKVRGSPTASKRQFLKNKGLTDAEIDEAFRRVPETALPTTAPPASTAALQNTANHLQPAPYTAAPVPYQQPQEQITPQRPPVHWPQVLAGAGFTAAGAYAVKSLVWPYIADTYRSIRGKPPPSTTTIEPEATTNGPAATTTTDTVAAQAVAEAIKEQTSELREAIQSIQAVAQALNKNSKDKGGDIGLTANDLRQELRAFAATLSETPAPARSVDTNTTALSLETELAEIKGLLADYLKTPRSGSRTPVSVSDTIDRGVVLPNTLMSAVSTAAATSEHQQPYYPTSKTPPTGPSSHATSAMPSPAGKHHYDSDTTHTADPSPLKTEGSMTSFHSLNEPATVVKEGKNPSYMEVLEMLEKGQTPPGIRTDINDRPPNPNQPPPPPRLKPLPKPWEKTPSSGDVKVNAVPSSLVIDEQSASSDTTHPDSSSKPSSSISFNPKPREPFSPINPSEHLEEVGDPSSAVAAPAAESIYQAAVVPAPESPNVIAGRFSPSKSTGGSSIVSGVSRKLELYGDDGNSNLSVPDGNGLGRPFLRPARGDWNPPPIPTSSLSSRGSVGAREQGEEDA